MDRTSHIPFTLYITFLSPQDTTAADWGMQAHRPASDGPHAACVEQIDQAADSLH